MLKKLTHENWNINKVKANDYDWFCLQIDQDVENGKIKKPSKTLIKKVYKKLTRIKIK